MAETYKFTKGSGGFSKAGLSPDEIASELLRIEKKYGSLQSETVLQMSEDPSATLHDCFVWDDTQAAHSFRMWQVRKLIRSVVIERPSKRKGRVVQIALMHSATDSEGNSGYFNFSKVENDEMLYLSALQTMFTQLTSLDNSIEGLKQLAPKSQKAKIAKVGSAVKTVSKAAEALS